MIRCAEIHLPGWPLTEVSDPLSLIESQPLTPPLVKLRRCAAALSDAARATLLLCLSRGLVAMQGCGGPL